MTKKRTSSRWPNQGDADALYQLGLAYQSGVHVDQNDAVAQRFFFYANQKGHPLSGQYLDLIEKTVPTPSLSYAPSFSAAPPIADAPKQIETAQVKKEEEVLTSVVDSKATASATPTVNPAPNVTKEASNTAVTPPRILATPKTAPHIAPKPKTAWRYFTYFLIVTGLCLLAVLIAIKILHHLRPQSLLPKGFDGDVYLELNPDVKRAGAHPMKHYLKHGQAEGRQFRR